MEETKEMKLTAMSSEVFNYVKANGGEASIPELEAAIGRSAKSISANVTDLQKKELVARDKRTVGEDSVTYVVLTEAGKAFNC